MYRPDQTAPFTPPPLLPDGGIFLGLDAHGRRDGVAAERHLCTFGGSRSGKGAALIIPVLKSWSGGSVLVIDPKGENAAASWQEREAMGHKVHVLDPFRVADVPRRLRASFNPLAAIYNAEGRLDQPIVQKQDGETLSARQMGELSTAREDIRVIAEGLVMRHAAENPVWDNGAVTVLAGVIAHNLATAEAGLRSPPAMRSVLDFPAKPPAGGFSGLAGNPPVGGADQNAAPAGPSEAKSALEFVKGARDHTEWLNSQPMASVLTESTFDLADLKNGKTAVFLVLPPQYLQEHGRFLRLFVMCALNTMARAGLKDKGKCLFILDEMASLGFLPSVYSAAGLMPAYGVHLWPFFQDLGQLVKLYGKEGAETFFGNADAHIFFGNTDPLTLQHISGRLGVVQPEEIGPPPVHVPSPPSQPHGWASLFSTRRGNNGGAQMLGWAIAGSLNAVSGLFDHLAAQQSAEWQVKARRIGSPRLAPEAVRELVGKGAGDKVARSMIVFGPLSHVWNLRLAPYFEHDFTPPALRKAVQNAAANAAASGNDYSVGLSPPAEIPADKIGGRDWWLWLLPPVFFFLCAAFKQQGHMLAVYVFFGCLCASIWALVTEGD